MNAERESTSRHGESRRLQAIYWAGVLIWAGAVFTAESTGHLPQVGTAGAWSWVFFGAGLYALVGALWREASPKLAGATIGDYVWAGVLIIIGLGGFVSLKITWPLVLLSIGLGLLAHALLGRRQLRP